MLRTLEFRQKEADNKGNYRFEWKGTSEQGDSEMKGKIRKILLGLSTGFCIDSCVILILFNLRDLAILPYAGFLISFLAIEMELK